jgi:hypothetical protein
MGAPVRWPGRAFVAVDRGTATKALTLVGLVAGRWRLLASTAVPAGVETDAALALLGAQLERADPDVARELGLEIATLLDLPRLEAATAATRSLAVVGVTNRALGPLGTVAERAGWRTRRASMEHLDPLAMLRFLLDGRIDAILAGAGDPAGADERTGLSELAAVVAAVAERRPDLPIVLAGALATAVEEQPGLGGDAPATWPATAATSTAVGATEPGGGGPVEGGPEPSGSAPVVPAPSRSRPILFAPAATAGAPPGGPLERLLAGLAGTGGDGRAAIARAAGTLAGVLRRRLEVVDVGHDGGLRVRADPPHRADRAPEVRSVRVPAAALVPGEVTEELLDGVHAWSTQPLERSRLRDLLVELRRSPWAAVAGEGAHLRLAAAEAALARLAAATPELGALPAPDLLVLAGGTWSAVPGPAVALAAANALRRPGAWQIAYDHARLLGPLGAIEAEDERAAIVADLADDLLLPIGSVVMPAGLRAEEQVGSLIVHGPTGPTELGLVPGSLELVDLAPGERGLVELRFRRAVVLGSRGRRFAFDIAGGLGGLLVDLRDVPLRLPDRAARRRELLRAWQVALWPGSDDGRTEAIG